MTFYLQDVSDGKPLTHENTISTVTVQLLLEPLAVTPDIYPFAAHLGHVLGYSHIISIGCRAPRQLAQFHPRFEIIGLDSEANLEPCKKQYPFADWIEWDPEKPDWIPLQEEILKHSMILCTNVIESLTNPGNLLDNLKKIMDHAPICILSISGSNFTIGETPPAQNIDGSYKEWLNPSKIEAILRSRGFNVAFIGSTASSIIDVDKNAVAAIIEKNSLKNGIHTKAPEDFRVVAIMTAYNEEDIILPSIQFLIDQGVSVYLIDNWSTDATYTLAEQLLGKGLIGVEKFPKEAPTKFFALENLLGRDEELTREIQADWFIHYDVDEIRESCWPGVSLKDAIYWVDRAGFNCIDHTVIEFQPTDNDYIPGSDFRSYFKYFQFARRPGDFVQIKAWKNFGQVISLAETGGHEVCFEGRRIYPYKFLLKHYQVRSQSHGEKKIWKERKARWNPDEKAKGWHAHYDSIRQGDSFLRSPWELDLFDETIFNRKYLLERLSGIGVARAALVNRNAGFEAQAADIEARTAVLGAKNAALEAKTIGLEAKNAALEATTADLEAKTADLESFLYSLSKKWWIRWVVYANRLLGRKHRLDHHGSEEV